MLPPSWFCLLYGFMVLAADGSLSEILSSYRLSCNIADSDTGFYQKLFRSSKHGRVDGQLDRQR